MQRPVEVTEGRLRKGKKKEKERSRSGAGASSRPRWKFMAVMGFLAPFIEDPPSPIPPTLMMGHVGLGDGKGGGESLSVFERGLLEALRAPPTPAPAPAPPLQQGLTAADEDEVFFLSLLPTMRRLPPPKKAEVKFLIHKLLFEAERDSRE
ncbi:hypothetical protein ACEWY4_001506 [Coilia grayii]|uniref:BESS domain-containing protein n=1 Tax=Coilia grayii TaxID=363190 RepID=A0ABD1KT85_9TELE